MKQVPVRVEPFSTYLERRRKGAIFPVIVAGRQADLVLDQMKAGLEAAGSSLEPVVKCNVYCADAIHFEQGNTIYARHFPVESPARIFLCVAPFPGPFEIEVDCIAVV